MYVRFVCICIYIYVYIYMNMYLYIYNMRKGETGTCELGEHMFVLLEEQCMFYLKSRYRGKTADVSHGHRLAIACMCQNVSDA